MGKSKKKKAAGSAATDDELLDQAIADNAKLAEKRAEEQRLAEAQQQMQQAPASEPPPAKAALSPEAIIEKLNAVPTFCLLNGDQNIVSMEDGEGEESCAWFTDADEAREMLKAAKAQNPDVPLHMGVTPLGLAFALAVGWAESIFVGNMRLQGKSSVVSQMSHMLQQQLEAQGMEPSTWHLPVFCCDELSSPTVMPVFLSRADLVAAWITSGRSRESVPPNLAVIDLRVLVSQMQTDAFAWSTVAFVGSPRSVELVREAKTSSALLTGHGQPGGAPMPPVAPMPSSSSNADEPPPLLSDDHGESPPPLA